MRTRRSASWWPRARRSGAARRWPPAGTSSRSGAGQASGAIVFYRNTGSAKSARFELVSERIDDLRPGRRTSPALVDVDGDRRLDLVVGREEPGAAIYRNAGSATSPKFVELKDVALPLPTMATPVFGDLDGDGRLDLLAGTYSGGVVFLRRR